MVSIWVDYELAQSSLKRPDIHEGLTPTASEIEHFVKNHYHLISGGVSRRPAHQALLTQHNIGWVIAASWKFNAQEDKPDELTSDYVKGVDLLCDVIRSEPKNEGFQASLASVVAPQANQMLLSLASSLGWICFEDAGLQACLIEAIVEEKQEFHQAILSQMEFVSRHNEDSRELKRVDKLQRIKRTYDTIWQTWWGLILPTRSEANEELSKVFLHLVFAGGDEEAGMEVVRSASREGRLSCRYHDVCRLVEEISSKRKMTDADRERLTGPYGTWPNLQPKEGADRKYKPKRRDRNRSSSPRKSHGVRGKFREHYL
jgi:hypothetical protein